METEMTDIIHYAQGDSSLGPFVAAQSGRGLAAVAFGEISDSLLDTIRARFPGATLLHAPAVMKPAIDSLAALIDAPAAEAGLPLDMRGTEFELSVWNALRAIPAGRTASYGEIAAKIGSPRQAREVGEACAANPLAVIVPCHRVVKKDGSLSGYRWGVRRKRALIEREHRALFQLA
jgi:AraC family transcriptional regulator of adaptative response/methylated-DNA-[protein]-cysteine methyltransferase